MTAARYCFSSAVTISAGVALGLCARRRSTYALTAGACTRAPRSMIDESTFAAALGLSSVVASSWVLAFERALMCGLPVRNGWPLRLALSERTGPGGGCGERDRAHCLRKREEIIGKRR